MEIVIGIVIVGAALYFVRRELKGKPDVYEVPPKRDR